MLKIRQRARKDFIGRAVKCWMMSLCPRHLWRQILPIAASPLLLSSPLIKCLKQKCWIAESTLLYAPVYLCSGAKPTNRGCFKLTWISRYFLTYINIYCLHIYFLRSVPASNWGKNGRYKNNEDRENTRRCSTVAMAWEDDPWRPCWLRVATPAVWNVSAGGNSLHNIHYWSLIQQPSSAQPSP